MLVTQETTTRYRRTTSQGVPEAKLGYTPGVTPEYLAIPLSETVMTRYPDYRMAYWKDESHAAAKATSRPRTCTSTLLGRRAERIMAIDPGTPHGMQGRGAQHTGKPVHNTTICHPPEPGRAANVKSLGRARGRQSGQRAETEVGVSVNIMVSEDGASVYSHKPDRRLQLELSVRGHG